jgi:4-amino-4-deoxy-L-arabinose transferase-like glycosyltransferase
VRSNKHHNDHREKGRRDILLLVCIGLLVRFILWFVSSPTLRSDSVSYVEFAERIRDWNFAGFTGARTPGYPLFLLLCGLDLNIVHIVQGITGVIASVLLYRLIAETTGRRILALMAGIVYSLNINWLLYEGTILTESLSILLLLLVALLFRRLYSDRGDMFVTAIWLGLAVAVAALTRPLFVYLIPVVPVFMAMLLWRRRRWLVAVLNYTLPVAMLILAWCMFNKDQTGYFGVTTLTGYNLTQHSGAFIELAPQEYDDIKAVYLKHRADAIASGGNHSMTIWGAIPEMQQATGLTYPELSSRLTHMSVGLFIDHPGLYLPGVARSWLLFWAVAKNNAAIGRISSPQVAAGAETLLRAERYPMLLLNALFLCAALYVAVQTVIYGHWRRWGFAAIIITIVLCGSVVQALMEYGENARYAIPFQPLVLLTVAVVGESLVTGFVRSRQRMVTEPEIRSVG